MCEFISWIELDGKVFFLSNDELNTKAGRKLIRKCKPEDLYGHGSIREYYPELKSCGKNRECTDFSKPENFPPVIVKAFKAGRMSEFGRIPKCVLTEEALAEYEKINGAALAESAWAEYEKINGAALAESAWAEYEKINGAALAEYQKIKGTALAEYEKINGPALAEYQKIKGTAWAEYQKINGPALAEYQKINGTAWAEYQKIKGTALAEYQKIKGTAFWKLFRNRKNRIKAWR
jgi:hypothetical protein